MGNSLWLWNSKLELGCLTSSLRISLTIEGTGNHFSLGRHSMPARRGWWQRVRSNDRNPLSKWICRYFFTCVYIYVTFLFKVAGKYEGYRISHRKTFASNAFNHHFYAIDIFLYWFLWSLLSWGLGFKIQLSFWLYLSIFKFHRQFKFSGPGYKCAFSPCVPDLLPLCGSYTRNVIAQEQGWIQSFLRWCAFPSLKALLFWTW